MKLNDHYAAKIRSELKCSIRVKRSVTEMCPAFKKSCRDRKYRDEASVQATAFRPSIIYYFQDLSETGVWELLMETSFQL